MFPRLPLMMQQGYTFPSAAKNVSFHGLLQYVIPALALNVVRRHQAPERFDWSVSLQMCHARACPPGKAHEPGEAMRLTGGGPFCTMHELGECRRGAEINASVPGKALRISAGGYDHLFHSRSAPAPFQSRCRRVRQWKDENFVTPCSAPSRTRWGRSAMFCLMAQKFSRNLKRLCSPAESALRLMRRRTSTICCPLQVRADNS